jgi:hypothetical protein
MKIDGLREGDTVLVRAKVKLDVDPGDEHLHVKAGYQSIALEPDDVHSLVGRGWREGDRVQCTNAADYADRGPGIVLAIIGDFCWVNFKHRVVPETWASLLLSPENLAEPPPPAAPEGV